MSDMIIRGSGGGGKGGSSGSSRAPVESPDSLRSRQYARVVDLVSEGEIEGLVSGLHSVFLDDTPVQNSDGTFNFSGVTLVTRNGTQSQAAIPGFPQIEAETSVSTEVVYGLPVVRSISNPNISATRITVSVPQLTYQDRTTGDLSGTSVQVSIDVQSNGGGYVPARLAQVTAALSLIGAYAVSAGEIVRADLTVYWSGNTSVGYQTVQWQVNYRLVGAPAWSVLASGSFAGAPYEDTVFVSDGWEGGWYQTTVYPPTAAQTVGLDLALGRYEFQVVRYLGTGDLSFSGGTATQWTGIDTISGKTTSRYQRSYRIPLSGSAPWDIRVTRVTADSGQSNVQNRTYFDSFTEIIDAQLTCPNSALMALAIDAEQFQSIPRRGYDIKGLKIRIPVNYDPLTREYTGVWDGSFKIAWSDNPVWCFYDLLTSERYGLGDYLDDAQIDKWTLYQIGRYCDELVPDGFGGQEPRFTCNLYLQAREEAYKVLMSMASIFRSMIFWSAGAITASQDAPSDPVASFTPANVVDGAFNYSGSSVRTRHTVALVAWNDPDDRYRQKIEYVEDAEGIARYGVQQAEVVAIGCSSRGQAHRMGRWMLYTERMETETVSFKTGLDGLAVAPGEIIQTSDPVRAGVRLGGRLLSATTSGVTLDADVTIESGKTYTLWVILPDGSMQSRAVSSSPATGAVLTVSLDFDQAPQELAVWVLAASDLAPELWRVVSMTEVDGVNAEVAALAYHPEKYAEVELDLFLEPTPTSSLSSRPGVPSGLTLSESLYLTGSEVKARVQAGWVSADAVSWVFEWRREGGNWQQKSVTVAETTIDDVTPGIYEVRLSASNAIGARGPAISSSVEVYGKTAPPADVAGFSVIKSSGMAIPSWTLSPDLDVRIGGRIVVRHSPETVGATWEGAYIIEEFDGNAVSGLCALMTGTYFAKARDSSGNYSINAVSFEATEGMVTGFTTVASVTEHSAFAGTKNDLVVVENGLQISGAALIDELVENIDAAGIIDSLGGILSSGEYTFAGQIDCGTVAVRRFQADLQTFSFDVGNFIDQRTDRVDQWSSIDGESINDCDLTLYASVTDDDPSGAPAWGAWTPFFVSDFSCRAARFKALLTSGATNHNIAVSRLRVAAKLPA